MQLCQVMSTVLLMEKRKAIAPLVVGNSKMPSEVSLSASVMLFITSSRLIVGGTGDYNGISFP